MQNQTSPLILTFGVSDPVGATGIHADLATFAAFGCHGLSVVTALLIGDTARVEDLQETEADWVSDQGRVLLEDMTVAAFKIGAVASVEQVSAIAEIISDYPDVPLVLDPFLSNLPGAGLGDEDTLTAIRQILVPQATVLLLSQGELERLAETWREPSSDDLLAADVAELTGMGCQLVLVTGTAQGGSGEHASMANTLFDADGEVRSDSWQHLPGPFVGAGSTMSAALAALLARGLDVCEAIEQAQEYTVGALAHAQRFGMGKLVPNRFFRTVPPLA